MAKKDIPNLLTIGRFVLIVPLVVSATLGNYFLAIIIFTISGITDILDGVIARKYNFISDFGKLMDPLADKLTQISMLTVLVVKHCIPLWILLVVALKEFLLVSGASFLYGKELVVHSKWYGKATTVTFYSAIVAALLLEQFEKAILLNNFNFLLLVDDLMFYVAIIFTMFSLIMYIKAFYVYKYFKPVK